MKKLLSFVLVSLLLGAAPVASAEEGVVGNIYSTDILAYVNGRQIDSFNIGGRTVILVEDLYDWENSERGYGFTWNYNDESRTLTVSSDGSTGFGSFEAPRGQTGSVLGNVYATDIKVFLNGQEVPGYNIGGRTAVCIEDLGTVDETSPNFQFGYSKYLCNFKWDEENRTVMLNSYIRDDYNSFVNYPDFKLKFLLKDNILTCSFDQMNSYSCSFGTEFSDDYKNDTYKLKTVFINGEAVGTMFIDNDEFVQAQYNRQVLYRHAKDLSKMLSYEEAKQYVSENFEILDTREEKNATTYLAKQGDVRYLLHAMKNGGLVQNGVFDSSFTTVELGEIANPEASDFGRPYVYLYPFGGPHGATGCQLIYETDGFDFFIPYDDFKDSALSQYTATCTTLGTADLMIDGQHHEIDAIEAYEYNGHILVDADKMTELLGIDYHFRNGDFVFEASGEKHEISISLDTAQYHEPVYKEIYHMFTGDILLNGEKTAFTCPGGGTLLTNGKTYEKEVQPYLYEGKAYIPFHFLELRYQ